MKGNPPFLNEETFSLCETDCSFWMIEDGELHIQLQKAHKAEAWAAALKGHGQLDMFSEQEVNKKLMLERFQEEHPGFDLKRELQRTGTKRKELHGWCPPRP